MFMLKFCLVCLSFPVSCSDDFYLTVNMITNFLYQENCTSFSHWTVNGCTHWGCVGRLSSLLPYNPSLPSLNCLVGGL